MRCAACASCSIRPRNPRRPRSRFLRCPRELPLGAPLELQGHVDGLPPGETAALTLVGPDGSTTEAATSPAGRDGSAAFTIRAPAPPTVGRFDWRLRLTRGGTPDDPLGVAVVRPALPRVLVLEATPRFDTSALRRWFEEAGGTLAARTQIGKDLYRFFGPAGNGGAPREFTAIDGPLLAGYDLVLADGRSLLALKDPERAALAAAISDGGLGVLTLADDAVLPAAGAAAPGATKSPAAALLPWTLRPVNGGPGVDDPAAENADRSVRLRWPGMTLPMNAPAEAAPWEIALQPTQIALIRDDQGRAVAAAAPQGQGNLALTLVRETGRWNRAADPGRLRGVLVAPVLPTRAPGRCRRSLVAGGRRGRAGARRRAAETCLAGNVRRVLPACRGDGCRRGQRHLAVHPGCGGAGPLAGEVLAAPSRLAPGDRRSWAKRRRPVRFLRRRAR